MITSHLSVLVALTTRRCRRELRGVGRDVLWTVPKQVASEATSDVFAGAGSQLEDKERDDVSLQLAVS